MMFLSKLQWCAISQLKTDSRFCLQTKKTEFLLNSVMVKRCCLYQLNNILINPWKGIFLFKDFYTQTIPISVKDKYTQTLSDATGWLRIKILIGRCRFYTQILEFLFLEYVFQIIAILEYQIFRINFRLLDFRIQILEYLFQIIVILEYVFQNTDFRILILSYS